MLKFSSLALFFASSLVMVNTATAHALNLSNNSFETGDFTGWTTTGETTVETSNFGVAPTDGTYQAILETSDLDTGIGATELETFLDLSNGSLTNLDAIEGSAMKQTITVKAGDTLSFDWNFLTDDLQSEDYNDFAFISLTNVKHLADTFSPTLFSFSRIFDETGYQNYSYQFQTTGTYTLGFGIVDVGDDTVNSGLLLDNLKITQTFPNPKSVPEPTSLFAITTALGISAFFKKKSKERLN